MRPIVLDCSVAMAWCFEDEASAYSDRALERAAAGGAIVPAIWPLEALNVLLVAERRGRISAGQSARIIEILSSLPIKIDQQTGLHAGGLMETARNLNLSAYDAAYLDLAARSGAPLATIDKSLKKAAKAHGVALFA